MILQEHDLEEVLKHLASDEGRKVAIALAVKKKLIIILLQLLLMIGRRKNEQMRMKHLQHYQEINK